MSGKSFQDLYTHNLLHRLSSVKEQAENGLYTVKRFAKFLQKLVQIRLTAAKEWAKVSEHEQSKSERISKDKMVQHVKVYQQMVFTQKEMGISEMKFVTEISSKVIDPLLNFYRDSMAKLKKISAQESKIESQIQQTRSEIKKDRNFCLKLWKDLQESNKIQEEGRMSGNIKLKEKSEKNFTKQREKTLKCFSKFELLIEQANNEQKTYWNKELPMLITAVEMLECERLTEFENKIQEYKKFIHEWQQPLDNFSYIIDNAVNALDTKAEMITYMQNEVEKHGLPKPPPMHLTGLPTSAAILATDTVTLSTLLGQNTEELLSTRPTTQDMIATTPKSANTAAAAAAAAVAAFETAIIPTAPMTPGGNGRVEKVSSSAASSNFDVQSDSDSKTSQGAMSNSPPSTNHQRHLASGGNSAAPSPAVGPVGATHNPSITIITTMANTPPTTEFSPISIELNGSAALARKASTAVVSATPPRQSSGSFLSTSPTPAQSAASGYHTLRRPHHHHMPTISSGFSSLDALFDAPDPFHRLGDPAVCYVRALYELKSDDPDDLAFNPGDIIRVTLKGEDEELANSNMAATTSVNVSGDSGDEADMDGMNDSEPRWWRGYRLLDVGRSAEGMFPTNYVQLIPIDENIPMRMLIDIPSGLLCFGKFLEIEHSQENLNFVSAVERYRNMLFDQDVSAAERQAKFILNHFISNTATEQINIQGPTQQKVAETLKSAFDSNSAGISGSQVAADVGYSGISNGQTVNAALNADIFDLAQAEIMKLLVGDTFQRFKKGELFAKYNSYRRQAVAEKIKTSKTSQS